MLVIYTLFFGMLFAIAHLFPLPARLPIIGSLAEITPLTWFFIWWAIYLGLYFLIRFLLTTIMRLSSSRHRPELNHQWSLVQRTLLPPRGGMVNGLLVLTALGAMIYLFWAVYGSVMEIDRLGMAKFFVLSMIIVIYSHAIIVHCIETIFVPPPTKFRAQSGPSSNEITLSWENPCVAAFSGVSLRRSATSPIQRPSEGDEVYRGYEDRFVDQECAPGIRYHYGLFALNENDKAGKPVQIIASAIDLPPDPQDIAWEVALHEIELRWELPLSPQIRHVVIVRRGDRNPENANDGEVVFQGAERRYRDMHLLPATNYYYTLYTVDAFGRTSPGAQLQAIATQAPSIEHLNIELTDVGLIHLSWINPVGFDSGILIVRKVGQDPESVDDGDVVFAGDGTEHIDREIRPATTYHYAVYSQFPRDIYGKGVIAHVTTEPPPAPIVDLTLIPSRTTVRLQWVMPNVANVDGLHIRRTIGAPAGSTEVGEFVYEGPDRADHSTTDAGLTPDQEYVYTAFTYNQNAFYSEGRSFAIRTLPRPVAPTFNPPALDEDTREITLSWQRVDLEANMICIKRWENETPQSFDFSAQDGNLVFQDRVLDSFIDHNVTSATTYTYVAYTVDGEGCASQGVSREIVTPEAWTIPIMLTDANTGVRNETWVPEALPINRYVDQIPQEWGLGDVTGTRLTMRDGTVLDPTRSLLDQRVARGAELTLHYDLDD